MTISIKYDAAFFMRLFERLLDGSYWDALVSAGDGFGLETYTMMSSIGERLSLAVYRFEEGAYIESARGPSFSTGSISFYRPTHAAGAVTIKSGSVVTASASGRRFFTTADAVFGSTDVGPITVGIVAEMPAYEWDLPGEYTRADGEILPGEIDTCEVLLQAPAYADTTFYVRQLVATTGGCPGELDGRGYDRGLPRFSGEATEVYRERIRRLPDTVSPDALQRLVHSVLDPQGITWYFIETWDIRYQTCYDAPSPNSGTPTYQAVMPTSAKYDSNLFSYDDTYHPSLPLKDVWLDEIEQRGAFVVQMQAKAINDLGLFYDDPGMAPSDFRSVTGQGRGTPAYDLTSAMDPSMVFPSAYDGFDFGLRYLQAQLLQQLQLIKAGGVAAIVTIGY